MRDPAQCKALWVKVLIQRHLAFTVVSVLALKCQDALLSPQEMARGQGKQRKTSAEQRVRIKGCKIREKSFCVVWKAGQWKFSIYFAQGDQIFPVLGNSESTPKVFLTYPPICVAFAGEHASPGTSISAVEVSESSSQAYQWGVEDVTRRRGREERCSVEEVLFYLRGGGKLSC